MNEAAPDAMLDVTRDATLATLRKQGAHAHDPVRFCYLEALAARMQAQPASVQHLLARKFDEAVADYRSRIVCEPEAPSKFKPMARDAATAITQSPLARLNHEISERAKDDARAGGVGGDIGGDMGDDMHHELGSPSDMKSVRRFAEVWSKISTAQQLSQALTRGPELAGPLNSHNLMLRAMSLMHGLSLDYLRRFLSQTDALLWLEQMNQHHALKDGKTARRGRTKKI
jgi:hypothetical protein